MRLALARELPRVQSRGRGHVEVLGGTTETSPESDQVLGLGRFEVNPSRSVGELDTASVERNARDVEDLAGFNDDARGPAIERIAEKRSAGRCSVYPNLMRPPRDRLEHDERCAPVWGRPRLSE
jgi:hypothetical protein